jgi:hypothetical protein
MEQQDRKAGKHLDEAEAPMCVDCQQPAKEMTDAEYELWVACKQEPVCAACSKIRAIRIAAATRGFRVGV